MLTLALNHYDSMTHNGISLLFTLQIALVFAIGGLTTILTLGAIFICALLFVLVRDDLPQLATHAASFLLAFAVLFLVHSTQTLKNYTSARARRDRY